MWHDVKYEPGQLKVVAYEADGTVAGEKIVNTAGKPHHIEIISGKSFVGQNDAPVLKADGKDLAYLTVKVVDKDGNLCPGYSGKLNFKVSGAAVYRASANGDPTCLESFQQPQMHLFSGQLTVLVQSGSTAGEIIVEVSAKGVKTARITLESK